MSLKGKQVFYRRPDSAFQYKWAPTEFNKKVNKSHKTIKKKICNARPGSQGSDNITQFVYKLVYINGEEQHLAYVECDYVG